MSLWERITAAVSALAKGESLGDVFSHLRTPPEHRVGFTIAVIALGAKLAKADGQVTRDEVTAFRQVFQIPAGEERHAAHVYNLARQDVAGFEEYARRVKSMFGEKSEVLCDVMEGLFHIAMADGAYHPNEDRFLHRIASIFGLGERQFRSLRARFVPDSERDPYEVLGVAPDADAQTIRTAWKNLVRECHPDRMLARGVPEEAVRMAQERLVAINRAWEEIQNRGK